MNKKSTSGKKYICHRTDYIENAVAYNIYIHNGDRVKNDIMRKMVHKDTFKHDFHIINADSTNDIFNTINDCVELFRKDNDLWMCDINHYISNKKNKKYEIIRFTWSIVDSFLH